MGNCAVSPGASPTVQQFPWRFFGLLVVFSLYYSSLQTISNTFCAAIAKCEVVRDSGSREVGSVQFADQVPLGLCLHHPAVSEENCPG